MRKAKFQVGDKVKLLRGKDIPNYSGHWVTGMEEYVGDTTTIVDMLYDKYTNQFRYSVEDNWYAWDERGLELVENKPTWKVLIVPLNDTTTEGRLFNGEELINTVTTTKCKDDAYSVEEACKVIVERLFFSEPSKTQKVYPNGTIVRITDDSSHHYHLPKGLLGRLVKYDPKDDDYVVDFGFEYGETHNCSKDLPNNTGLYLHESSFEVVDEYAI